MKRAIDVTPSARRLVGSLRDIGYDFVSALADLVDNCVSAGATRVDIDIVFDGPSSHVSISDDGVGMTDARLREALRFGTRRTYVDADLGRFGLGLKTASLSQCRRVTVMTRQAPRVRRIALRALDLDHIERTDRWEVIDPPSDSAIGDYLHKISSGPGTVVLWEQLDRVLPEGRATGGWARRRVETLAARSRAYLGMVFHRFLEGDAARETPLSISVNGEKVAPWNPFAPLEPSTVEMNLLTLEIESAGLAGEVSLRRYVLPPRNRFSSLAEFERLSGPAKWNRQQGLYLYRSDRLVQSGGWCGLRAADEHTKLARAALDFPTSLDPVFQINVAKMRALLPAELRPVLEKPINDLCRRADGAYRSEGGRRARGDSDAEDVQAVRSQAGRAPTARIGTSLMAAAIAAGESAALEKVLRRLRRLDPDAARALGW